jgi:outer membrane protein assembly factor BamB
VALDGKTLAVKNTFPADEPFVTSPVVVEAGKRVAVAAESKSGKVHLLDAASLKADIAMAAAPAASEHAALASWKDRGGVTWIAAPAGDKVVGLKVSNAASSPALEVAWTSPAVGASPVISVINDVVFAAARGQQGVVYALDSATGQPVWNSGKAISSRVSAAVSGGGGQLYVTDRGGMLYAFGYPMEH